MILYFECCEYYYEYRSTNIFLYLYHMNKCLEMILMDFMWHHIFNFICLDIIHKHTQKNWVLLYFFVKWAQILLCDPTFWFHMFGDYSQTCSEDLGFTFNSLSTEPKFERVGPIFCCCWYMWNNLQTVFHRGSLDLHSHQ